MKIAIIGSRNLTAENFGEYLPPECTEIVSGGAKGIDSCAADYARKNGQNSDKKTTKLTPIDILSFL